MTLLELINWAAKNGVDFNSVLMIAVDGEDVKGDSVLMNADGSPCTNGNAIQLNATWKCYFPGGDQ